MADISSNLLQVGGTAGGLGVIFYMILKMLEIYGGSNKIYKGNLKERDETIVEITQERDEWKEKAIACESEAKTLKQQLKEHHQRKRKYERKK